VFEPALTLTLSPRRGDSFDMALKVWLTSLRIQRGIFSRRGERFSLSPGEQRYLILESKVGIFEEVVHEDDEFAQTALAPSALGQ